MIVLPNMLFHTTPCQSFLCKANVFNADSDSSAKDQRPASSNNDKTLSFNAEMFLRVMSLCHTVVVEEDLDLPSNNSKKSSNGMTKKDPSDFVQSDIATETDSGKVSEVKYEASHSAECEPEPCAQTAYSSLGTGTVHCGDADSDNGFELVDFAATSAPDTNNAEPTAEPTTATTIRFAPTDDNTVVSAPLVVEMGPDGAPAGYAYQAESPDEGAFVSAASRIFGYQVIKRDSSGIQLVRHGSTGASILSNQSITQGLKNGSLTPSVLASETASSLELNEHGSVASSVDGKAEVETWEILAVNKFDSDRKRMSIVLRSPPQLGNIPIVFCKGADVAMIDPEVSIGVRAEAGASSDRDETQEWEIEQFLELETHLGDFASEGLRTLVLGMKVLSEEQLEEWLKSYKEALTAMKGRDEMLVKAALALEKSLYIVGATAIEDKLQKDVPKTIAKLSQAGIKLWVLTGDKRETAVEIGYSTAVLSPKHHVTEVPDEGSEKVRTQMAMEFMKLVKRGTLLQYQRTRINSGENRLNYKNVMFRSRKIKRRAWRFLRSRWIHFLRFIRWFDKEYSAARLDEIQDQRINELKKVRPAELRRNVRNRAESILREYLDIRQNGKSKSSHKLGIISRRHSVRRQEDSSMNEMSESIRQIDDLPLVFNRAMLSKSVLSGVRAEKMLGNREKSMFIGREGVEQIHQLEEENDDELLVDTDCLSMDSRAPMEDQELDSDYDRRRRTFLERIFAVDSQVRKGTHFFLHFKGVIIFNLTVLFFSLVA